MLLLYDMSKVTLLAAAFICCRVTLYYLYGVDLVNKNYLTRYSLSSAYSKEEFFR